MASRYRFRRAFGNVNSKFRGARRDTYPLVTIIWDDNKLWNDLNNWED